MTSLALGRPHIYLTDGLQGTLVRDSALVLGGAAVITLSTLIIVPLPFTPVPITLATLGVMAAGAALGPARGVLSALVYLLAGAVGAPIFSNGQSGVLLPTFGYIVGYVVAAFIAGQLARRRADRKPISTFGLAALSTLVLYVCGAPWLAFSLGIDLPQAVMLGVVPFLVGDALKALALTLVLPSAWAWMTRLEKRRTADERE